MIQIYCGDGKGKTTAAFGLALRAVGGGYSVAVAQFLKGRASGEAVVIAALPHIKVLTAELPDVFSWQMTTEQREQVLELHNDLFARATACYGGAKTMIILDELLGALSERLVDADMVMQFLREQGRREDAEIVITGRSPSAELLSLADYVTEMKKIKHPFDNGAPMRRGIEY